MEMSRFVRLNALVIALFGFAACAPVSYVEPDSGPVAKVRFATTTSDVTFVWQFDDAECNGSQEMFRMRNGFLVNSVARNLGMPGADEFREEAAKEVLIPANTPFHGMFMYESATKLGKRCASLISYTFEEDGLYELYFSKQGSRCQTELSEYVPSGASHDRKKLKIFDNFFEGSACEAKLTELFF